MRILVTAGPTREPVDAVRVLTNRSSGKMGYAVAQAGLSRGHEVLLVSGPVAIDVPAGARVSRVETAAEMQAAVQDAFAWCQALVMTAAVADWRPREPEGRKIKKSENVTAIALERTDDILAAITPMKGERVVVGFAAETENIISEAQRKLQAKHLDLVVANDVSRGDIGFDSDDNQVTLITEASPPEVLPLMSKRNLGELIVDWLELRASAGA